MRFLTVAILFLMGLMPGQSSSQTVVALSAPRLAVSPFDYPTDPDYGVFVADRLAAQLMVRSYSLALERRRFVLVEPDTLPANLTRLVASVATDVPEDALEILRRRSNADYLLTGVVDASGIRAVRARLLSLDDGKVLWSGEIRDDPSWTWSKANQNIGDIPVEEILNRLGFGETDVGPPPPEVEDLPSEIMIQPVFTTDWQYLAADCRSAVREGMTRDGVFSLVPGEIKGKNSSVLVRVGKLEREQAFETTIADAILCGSIAVTGEAGTIHNLGLALRLVEIETGQILWSHVTSGRKVWRWDKLSDIIATMTGQQLEAIALYGASNAEDMVAELVEQAVDGDSWSALGEAYLSRGLVDRAEESFDQALSFEDAKARAQNGLGQIFIRKPEYFAKAIDHFRKAIADKPDYLEPYSNLAQAYLERDMNDGIRYARQAIEKDQTYSLPYRVLGEYYARSEEDPKAVSYLKPYVELVPEDIETAVLLGRSLLRMKDYSGITQSVAPIYNARPDAIDLIPIIAIKDIRQRNYDSAFELFQAFLLRVTERERALYEDIRTVLPGQDIPAYNNRSQNENRVFRERFWREKDPDLTTELNERLLEHYGRVWFARRNFGDSAYPWDQRGAVYIRYGQPNYRSQSGRVPALTSPKVQQIKELMYADLYNVPPQGELVGPVFPIRSSRGIVLSERDDFVNDATGQGVEGDRALGLSDPQSRADGESYAPVTLFGDYSMVPWESWVYTEIGRGLVFDFTKEAGGASGFDFAPIPDIPPSIMKSSARMSEYAPQLAYERTVAELPDDFEAPEFAAIEDLEHETFSFRAEAFKTRLDVVYGMPVSSVRTREIGNGAEAVLNRSVALADSSYSRVFRRSDRVQIGSVDGKIVDLIRADFEPGIYHLTLRIHDALGGRLTAIEKDIRVEAYPPDTFGMSDLVLASSIDEYTGDVRFRRGKWEVRPNPGGSLEQPIVPFYYEIYGLKKNAFGQANYRVTAGVKHKQGLRNRPAFLGEAKPEVTFTFDQTGDQDWERGQLELDLTEAKFGTNILTLSVQDLESGKSVNKQVEFDYLETKN
jgi:GWxTD domain-containing protein